jgi:glycosyltransferase involved in cell wall biosynthesis
VEKIMVVCRHRGPEIPRVEYYCSPRAFTKIPIIAIIYEFFILLYLAIFQKADLVLGYLLFPHGLLAFIVAKLIRRPVVVALIAGPVELYSIGSPLGIDYNSPLPWFGRALIKLLNHSNAITTTGTFTKAFLVRHGIEQEKIYPIITPANSTKFYPMKLTRIFDVVSVARLSPGKHIEVLVKAISIAKQKYKNIKVCIVGDGPCEDELLILTEELGLNNNIDFVGFQKDVAYYYSSSKIFVHTSEREGFPNVFLEAMMCGLPSVVSNCGDITDLASDGINAIVIERYSDYEKFAEAIINLINDEELYYKLSRNALKTVMNLNAKEITKKWENILSVIV